MKFKTILDNSIIFRIKPTREKCVAALHSLKKSGELKTEATQPDEANKSELALVADALNVTSRCSSSVTSARPLLLDTGAFGALLACGFDEEVRIFKLSDVRRVARGNSDSGQEPAGGGVGGFIWHWPHWQRLTGVHDAVVRDIQASPDSEIRLITCGMDGRLAVWNYPAGQVVSVFKLVAPVLRVLPMPSLANEPTDSEDDDLPSYYCLMLNCRRHKSKLNAAPSYRLAAINNRTIERKEPGRTLMRNIQPDCLSASQSGRFIVSANASNLLVYRPSRQRLYNHYACDGFHCRIVSVAAHPSQRSAAVGLSDGRVLIMHGLFTSGRPVSTVLQWHFRPVSGLVFAADGCALYSGGQEAVLVKWDTSPEAGESIGSRTFLPRLGARIVGAVCGPNGSAAAAVTLSDNSLLVLDSNMGLAAGLNGGLLLVGDEADEAQDADAATGDNRQLGLLRDPLTECVAMAGQAGAVQFYSVSEQRHLGCLDVAKANYTAVASSVVAKVTSARVELAAFSDAPGAWLATFDRRDDGRYEPELRLRFWLRRCARPLVDCETVDVNADAVLERLAFSQCGEERLTDRIVGMAFQPGVGERKFVCAFSDGSLACWTRQERVQHLAKRAEEAADFASYWILTRTWRLGYGFTGGPLAFDPTGRYLLTCHQSQACGAAWRTADLACPPAMFRLYDAAAPKVTDSRLLAFCSMWDSGQSVVLCGRDRLRVWDRQSGRKLAEAPLTIAAAAEDYKSGMLILLCLAERALLMLHSCEPGQLSRISLNCPSDPIDLCVTEDTFVFLTRDRRVFVYPEPASALTAMDDGDTAKAELTSAAAVAANAELEAESARAASLLGRVFGRQQIGPRAVVDPVAALEARLRLFAESDAFAAPNLTRFVAGNLRLTRQHLLAASAAKPADDGLDELADGAVGVAARSRPAVADDAESDDDLTMEQDGAAGAAALPDLSEAAFNRIMCRCLSQLSRRYGGGGGGGGLRLHSLRQMKRLQRKNRRELRLAAAKAGRQSAAIVEADRPAMTSEADAAAATVQDAQQLPDQPQQAADTTADSESDLIIVSATMATTPATKTNKDDDDDEDEAEALMQRRRPAKRRANGELAVDLDEESMCSGDRLSSSKKRHQRRKLST